MYIYKVQKIDNLVAMIHLNPHPRLRQGSGWHRLALSLTGRGRVVRPDLMSSASSRNRASSGSRRDVRRRTPPSVRRNGRERPSRLYQRGAQGTPYECYVWLLDPYKIQYRGQVSHIGWDDAWRRRRVRLLHRWIWPVQNSARWYGPLRVLATMNHQFRILSWNIPDLYYF